MMPSMSGKPSTTCQKNLKSCPPGHEVKRCDSADEHRCQQCESMFFQPNENRIGDNCRWRKICDKPFMTYENFGSLVKDAECKCHDGFHFENEDQRACVPNRECDKGYGQGQYGVCENCLEKMMYSDTKDRTQKCKPLRNCQKEMRCTKRKSNGTFDNICGPVVRDVNDCSSIVSGSDDDGAAARKYAIIGGVVGALVIFVIIIIVVVLCRRRQKRTKDRPLTEDQLEELKKLIIQKCEKDEDLCRKVLSEAFSQIEARIDRQSWSLAQGLFRLHPITGKYELLVETYKEKALKDTVRGYLNDWKSWRGENQTAVKEIFQCLSSCKRDDIVYEICNKLRHDVGDVCLDGDETTKGSANNRAQDSFYCDLGDIFPCITKPEKQHVEKGESPESTNKLLEEKSRDTNVDPQTAGAIYRERPYPSAPTFEESNGLLVDPEIQFYRQYSQPVQATT